jgi:hypothetical protein
MKGKAGDRVLVESERAAQPGRSGVIEEVLQERPARFRVRWDDGRESILAPAAGAVRIEAKTTKKKTAGRAR